LHNQGQEKQSLRVASDKKSEPEKDSDFFFYIIFDKVFFGLISVKPWHV